MSHFSIFIGVLRKPLSIEEISVLSDKLLCIGRKILKILHFSDEDTKHQVVDHLRRFNRTLNPKNVAHFARFCTGAVFDVILVRLVDSKRDFSWSPIAHTCSCVLELSEEFSNVLKSKNKSHGHKINTVYLRGEGSSHYPHQNGGRRHLDSDGCVSSYLVYNAQKLAKITYVIRN